MRVKYPETIVDQGIHRDSRVITPDSISIQRLVPVFAGLESLDALCSSFSFHDGIMDRQVRSGVEVGAIRRKAHRCNVSTVDGDRSIVSACEVGNFFPVDPTTIFKSQKLVERDVRRGKQPEKVGRRFLFLWKVRVISDSGNQPQRFLVPHSSLNAAV